MRSRWVTTADGEGCTRRIGLSAVLLDAGVGDGTRHRRASAGSMSVEVGTGDPIAGVRDEPALRDKA
jgi:hypothetical protein